MTRLRRVAASTPGWTRRRAGRGFTYRDRHGDALAAADVARIRVLAIPPAWVDVWICPIANGHLQATGVDAAGRRQYLYHPAWRIKRDAAKHERVTLLARRFPRLRRHVLDDLASDAIGLERAAATAVRLLDLGCFRIGNDAYADEHGSFGLTTLERRHVRRQGDGLVFVFTGKSGIEHTVEIDDPVAVSALEPMRRRRGGSERLLVYKSGRRWRPLTSGDVNDYLHERMRAAFTAKDFRTWHATVLAAVALAGAEPAATPTARRRVIKAAMEEVSSFLGNTPTIARKSYVDPRIVDLYERNTLLPAAVLTQRHRTADARRAALERATLRLLDPTR